MIRLTWRWALFTVILFVVVFAILTWAHIP